MATALKLPVKLRYRIKEKWKAWGIRLERFEFETGEMGFRMIEVLDSDGNKIEDYKAYKKGNVMIIKFKEPTSGTAVFEIYAKHKKRKGWLL